MENEKNKALISAADFYGKTAKKLLTTERGLHAETLIISVARMSGSLLFRSFGIKQALQPGTAVLSEQANIEGPKLMNLMFATLQQLGDTIGEGNLDREYASAKYSQLTFKESHERLAPFFLKYCEVGPISHRDAALGAAIASGILIHECKPVLDITKGAAIAVYGFIEGTKTASYPDKIA